MWKKENIKNYICDYVKKLTHLNDPMEDAPSRSGQLCSFEPPARDRFVRKPDFIRPESGRFKPAQFVRIRAGYEYIISSSGTRSDHTCPYGSSATRAARIEPARTAHELAQAKHAPMLDRCSCSALSVCLGKWQPTPTVLLPLIPPGLPLTFFINTIL